MITATIYGAEEVRAKLESVFPAARASLRDTVARLAIDLQRHVVSDKLSGQVLKNRTGTLRRSINQHVEETDTSVTGVVGADMNAARYARAHEYGFRGTVEVRAHLRTMREAFGHTLRTPGEVNVAAHSMRMNLPERSYLRSSLRDMRSTILSAFEVSLREAVK
jgi:hypothetical protein